MCTAIQLPDSVKQEIIAHCTTIKPMEACGFLLGTTELSEIHVKVFEPIPNHSKNPAIHFSMHPAQMIPLLMNNLPGGYHVVGILHSHPSAASTPSHEDLLTLWHNIPSHWIVSLQQPEITIAAYRYFQATTPTNLTPSPHQYIQIPIHILHS